MLILNTPEVTQLVPNSLRTLILLLGLENSDASAESWFCELRA